VVSTEKSLLLLIEKWIAPTTAMPLRATRFGRTQSNQPRCIRVETLRPSGPLEMLFFQHDDGTWRVFPPEGEG
jgi:hypothetical protein